MLSDKKCDVENRIVSNLKLGII